MNAIKTPIGAILKVNGHLLMTFLYGGSAWLIWPANPKWWGFGVLSILLGAAALASLIAGFRAMTKLYVRERAMAKFAQTAREPMPSDLADIHSLKDAGMIDE